LIGYNESSLLTNAFGRTDLFVINGFNCIQFETYRISNFSQFYRSRDSQHHSGNHNIDRKQWPTERTKEGLPKELNFENMNF
jgi:hypothetical protein